MVAMLLSFLHPGAAMGRGPPRQQFVAVPPGKPPRRNAELPDSCRTNSLTWITMKRRPRGEPGEAGLGVPSLAILDTEGRRERWRLDRQAGCRRVYPTSLPESSPGLDPWSTFLKAVKER